MQIMADSGETTAATHCEAVTDSLDVTTGDVVTGVASAEVTRDGEDDTLRHVDAHDSECSRSKDVVQVVHAAGGGDDAWPEAIDVGGSWPEAADLADVASRGTSCVSAFQPQASYVPSSSSCSSTSSATAAWPEATNSGASAACSTAVTATPSTGDSTPTTHPAQPTSSAGLRGLIAQLTWQLEDEVRRREAEEKELDERENERAALNAELEAQRRRRVAVEDAAALAEQTARETQREREELARVHAEVRSEVGRQEEELHQLREDARARDGDGRDWARDGPEKDALVETKLQIAEAHDRLAQLGQQLWLNREGLRRQLADLQAEAAKLRARRGSSGAANGSASAHIVAGVG